MDLNLPSADDDDVIKRESSSWAERIVLQYLITLALGSDVSKSLRVL